MKIGIKNTPNQSVKSPAFKGLIKTGKMEGVKSSLKRDLNDRLSAMLTLLDGKFNEWQRVFNIILEGANPNTRDFLNRTYLHRAAEFGQNTYIKKLLGIKGIKPNRLDNYGNAPLHIAAVKGNIQGLRLLLDCKKVDPNRIGDKGTPLHIAVMESRLDSIKELLACDRVYTDIPDKRGETPYQLAERLGDYETAEYIKAHERRSPATLKKLIANLAKSVWKHLTGQNKPTIHS